MLHPPKPTTIIELEQWMKDGCYNFNSYSINGNLIYEGFGIEPENNSFVWYYTERGQKEPIKYFSSEKEATEFAYDQISKDIWAKTHCIGFSIDKDLIQQLMNELKNLGILFQYDEIPQNHQRKIHRILVYGCDYKKVEHLKKVYLDKM